MMPIGKRQLILRAVAAGGVLALPLCARAQSTSITLRATPSSASLAPGDTLTIDFFLDVTSLASGDNYTTARTFLPYLQNPSGGGTPATSPFSGTPTLTTFAGPGSSSGFSTQLSSSSALTASKNGVNYQGFGFSVSSGTTARTDTGVFLLARAQATLRSDLADGAYTFNFQDLTGTAGRTFVTGKFGPNNATSAPLTTQGFTIMVQGGGAEIMPDAPTLPLMLLGIAGIAGRGVMRLRARRKA